MDINQAKYYPADISIHNVGAGDARTAATNHTGMKSNDTKSASMNLKGMHTNGIQTNDADTNCIEAEIEPKPEATVIKALQEASLPITEQSKEIVKELLLHGLSIGGKVLQYLIRQSLQNKSVPASTLVEMYQNHIPITGENVLQYEAYQNGTNRIADELDELENLILRLFLEAEDNLQSQSYLSEDITKEIDSLLQRLKYINSYAGGARETPTHYVKIAESTHAHYVSQGEATHTQSPQTTDNGLAQQPASNEKNGTQMALKPESISNFIREMQNADDTYNPLTVSDTRNLTPSADLSQGTEQHLLLPSDVLQNAIGRLPFHHRLLVFLISGFHDSNDSIPGASAQNGIEPKEVVAQVTADDKDTIELNLDLSRNRAPSSSFNESVKLGMILHRDELGNLYKILREFPDSDIISSSLVSGNATNREVLEYILPILTRQSRPMATKLAQSPEYRKLLKGSLQLRWSLTPEQISQGESAKEFYRRLQKDIGEVKEMLLSNTDVLKNMHTAGQTANPAEKLLNQLDFMKAMNEVFPYIQLPVRFERKTVHSELHLFTRKDSFHNRKEPILAILHIDMPSLGITDVHIRLESKLIQAEFYLKEEASRNIVKDNLQLLTEALNRKGYQLLADIKLSVVKPDSEIDTSNQNIADTIMNRYTFDMKA